MHVQHLTFSFFPSILFSFLEFVYIYIYVLDGKKNILVNVTIVGSNEAWARSFKLVRNPRLDSKESIPPACVASWGRYDNPIPTRFLASIDCLKIPALLVTCNVTVLVSYWSRTKPPGLWLVAEFRCVMVGVLWLTILLFVLFWSDQQREKCVVINHRVHRD